MTKQSKNTRRKPRQEPVLHIDDREYTAWPTQKQVAETLGVHQKTVWRWEKGIQRPDKNTLLLLQILFCGNLPWPGFDQYRAVDTGRRTYHNKPIWEIRHRAGGHGVTANQITSVLESKATSDWLRDTAERKLEAMTLERDQMADQVQQLERQSDDLRAEIKRLEDIILERKKARANVVRYHVVKSDYAAV